jgi:hypothetical protein
VQWNLRGDRQENAQQGGGGGFGRNQGPMATPGVYKVTLTVNGQSYDEMVTVLEDVWLNVR